MDAYDLKNMGSTIDVNGDWVILIFLNNWQPVVEFKVLVQSYSALDLGLSFLMQASSTWYDILTQAPGS